MPRERDVLVAEQAVDDRQPVISQELCGLLPPFPLLQVVKPFITVKKINQADLLPKVMPSDFQFIGQDLEQAPKCRYDAGSSVSSQANVQVQHFEEQQALTCCSWNMTLIRLDGCRAALKARGARDVSAEHRMRQQVPHIAKALGVKLLCADAQQTEKSHVVGELTRVSLAPHAPMVAS